MTFYEAQKVIDDNIKHLDKYILHSNPPHLVLGCIVSTRQRSLDREQYIFTKCITEAESNEKVIFDLNLWTEDLIPFVALLIWGNNIIIPLDSYIAAPWTNPTDDGKAE